MKKLLSLAAVAGIAFSVAAPAAMADEFVARYTYLVNGAAVPTATRGGILNQSAVLDPCNSGCGNTFNRGAVLDNFDGGYGNTFARRGVLDNSCDSGCGNTLVRPAVLDNPCCPDTLTQSAVLDPCASPCGNVLPAVAQRPILVEHHENLVPHLFHLGLWPLIDFSIF